MNKKSLFILSLMIVFVFSITGAASAQRIQTENTTLNGIYNPAADFPWFTSWADKTSSDEVGAYPSIAFSPVDGLPYISYYDGTNGYLMLAHYVPNGTGNCGVNGSWECEVVDGDGVDGHSSNDVGKYSSLDFYRSTSGVYGWQLGISYYDATDNALKYAEYAYILFYGGGWDYAIVSPAQLLGSNGIYTALKFDTSGNPHIAYYNQRYLISGWVGYLKIANQVISGGNCGGGDDAGKWECTSIDSGDDAGVGKYASLDIDYDNQVYIAYYDENNGNLKYAYFQGIAGCLNGWECNPIDTTGDVGLFTSIKARQSSTDDIRIAYYDKTNGHLKYTSSGWSVGGNCGSGNSWYCMAVDDMGVGAGMARTGISMDLDSTGAPIIAYQDASEDLAPAKLNIARPANIFEETEGIGNCGDNVDMFEIWWCETLDTAGYGLGNVNVADYVSVAVNTTGVAAIAYFEEDNYNYTTALKVAFQRPQVYMPLVFR